MARQLFSHKLGDVELKQTLSGNGLEVHGFSQEPGSLQVWPTTVTVVRTDAAEDYSLQVTLGGHPGPRVTGKLKPTLVKLRVATQKRWGPAVANEACALAKRLS